MKNIQGTEEELKLYHKNGEVAYYYFKGSDGIYREYTYDKQGNLRAFKDSDGYSSKTSYDDNGDQLTFKNSEGYLYEASILKSK